MGAPVLIGAGIGAVGSLATGRDPLQGALLGGITGGAFGGAEGFGSGFTQGGLFNLGSAGTDAVASQGLNAATQSFDDALLTSDQLIGNTANPETMGLIADPNAINPAMQLDSSIGVDLGSTLKQSDPYNLSANMYDNTAGVGVDLTNYTKPLPTEFGQIDINKVDTSNMLGTPKPPSLFERLTTGAYDSFKDMSTMDKLSLGAMTMDAVSPNQGMTNAQRMIQPQKINPGKPLDSGNTGTGMLNIQVPGFMDEVKKNQIRSLFYKQ